MNPRSWNWRIWAGSGLVLLANVGYMLLFLRSRAVFWPCLLLLLLGVVFLVMGLKRAFGEPQQYRGKIVGPILGGISVLLVAMFVFVSYSVFKEFPAARNAPKVGQKAPEFTLVDSSGKETSLAQLLASPIGASGAQSSKGVLVVFYRGYW